MRCLYEFLVKQHVNPNKENEFELYQHKQYKDMVYMLINNTNLEYFLRNVKLPSSPYYTLCEIYDNLNVLVRPSKGGEEWRPFRFDEQINNQKLNQTFNLLDHITINEFTGNYWKKNKWSMI